MKRYCVSSSVGARSTTTRCFTLFAVVLDQKQTGKQLTTRYPHHSQVFLLTAQEDNFSSSPSNEDESTTSWVEDLTTATTKDDSLPPTRGSTKQLVVSKETAEKTSLRFLPTGTRLPLSCVSCLRIGGQAVTQDSLISSYSFISFR